MKIMYQLAIVFAICLIGEGISMILPFPVPGTVLSMIILFILLVLKIIKIEQIREKADFLLKNMAFFFIPAGVGLLASYAEAVDYIWPLLAVITIASFLTYTAAIFTVAGVMKLQNYFSSSVKENASREEQQQHCQNQTGKNPEEKEKDGKSGV